MDGDQEIVSSFLEKSAEDLDRTDRALVDLEANPSDPDLLAQVFRSLHTIKGSSGFLGFARLEALAHAGESLLSALRDGEITVDAEITTTLLRLMDAIRARLQDIEALGHEGEDEHSDLIADLLRHTAPDKSPHPPDLTIPEEPGGDAGAVPTVDAEASARSAVAEGAVRVNVDVLDALMNRVTELIVVQSHIGDLAQGEPDGPLNSAYSELRGITGQLQDGVMQARLQPIGNVTGRLRRIARDLASALGKQVQIEVDGENVGVDRAVNETLRDPLLHLVRNAIDHGIETPAERLAAGKSARGRLRVSAYHEHGRVHVELSDDGRGIDRQRLIARAVSSGHLSTGKADSLTDDEAFDLMFQPGLSTRQTVTNLSGRGVGMDVVRSRLQQIGGSIEITSTPGVGTTFRIGVPLTLAIMPTLSVFRGGERYALPLANVEEIIYLDPTGSGSVMEDIAGARVFRLRGHLLPCLDLSELLRLATSPADSARYLVVMSTEERRFGLLVAEVGETEDAVVKPMTAATRKIQCFSGVTIRGDGRPSLILDVEGLAGSAGIGLSQRVESAPVESDTGSEAPGLLLAGTTDGSRLAVYLDRVERLERFHSRQVEHLGDLTVVQSRDGILPLIRVRERLPERRAVPRVESPPVGSDFVQAIVCGYEGGLVALVVDQIEAVVPIPKTPAQPATRHGVLVCVIVEDRLTEILDIDTLARESGIGART